MYSDALDELDLRAIVLSAVSSFRQQSLSPDEYSNWSGS